MGSRLQYRTHSYTLALLLAGRCKRDLNFRCGVGGRQVLSKFWNSPLLSESSKYLQQIINVALMMITQTCSAKTCEDNAWLN